MKAKYFVPANDSSGPSKIGDTQVVHLTATYIHKSDEPVFSTTSGQIYYWDAMQYIYIYIYIYVRVCVYIYIYIYIL